MAIAQVLAGSISKDLALTAPAAVVAPPIQPTAAPAYQAPTNPYIPPGPTLAATPDGQTLGRGGVPFGSRPPIYIAPPVLIYDQEVNDEGYGNPIDRNKPAVPANQVQLPRDGYMAVMPVLRGQQPKKTFVEAVPTNAQVPPEPAKDGPISGVIAGFNLVRVPLWAWLVAAALLGSRLLK